MMFADTDWAAIVDKIGTYIIQILTMVLAFWAKMSASKASRMAGEANESAQKAEKKIDKAAKEAKEDITSQTAMLMEKIPEKVVEVANT